VRHNLILSGLALTILLGSLNFVQADSKADDKIKKADTDKGFNVHKMTILSGQTRTVHYFSNGSSPSEESALRELSRAENEAGYADDLLALRQQYLDTERAMESRRRQVQMALYGLSYETNTSAGNRVSGYSFGFPSIYGTPFDTALLTGGFFGSGFALGFPANGAGAGAYAEDTFKLQTDTKMSHSLAHGIGDEGKFKTEMVAMMAKQATPEYASQAARNLTSALADVTAVMDEGKRPGGVVPVDVRQKDRVVVQLKDGKRVDGYLLSEDANWMKVMTRNAVTVRLRMDNVARVDTLPK